MKYLFILLTLSTLFGCKDSPVYVSTEWVTRESQKDSLFAGLILSTRNGIDPSVITDSLAFLVLPLHASCPSCRKKTIDSLMKHKDKLLPQHYIILAADGGRKTMSSYFKDQQVSFPVIEGKLFLDSIGTTSKYDLFFKNPSMHYAVKGKVYKKVFAKPATVRADLSEFFTGSRNENE